MDIWLTIFKSALLIFIACGVLTIVVVYTRRGRAVRFRQDPDPHLGSLSQMGVVPPTPLPEWAYWADTEESEDGSAPPRR